jgi:hypothetical protein
MMALVAEMAFDARRLAELAYTTGGEEQVEPEHEAKRPRVNGGAPASAPAADVDEEAGEGVGAPRERDLDYE